MTTDTTHSAGERRARTAAALHRLAELVADPDCPLPTYIEHGFNGWCNFTATEHAAVARAAARHGFDVVKDHSELQMNLVVSFPGLVVRALANRANVCERVQVGTETVEHPARAEETVPAAEAWTEDVPVFEWRCAPLLANT